MKHAVEPGITGNLSVFEKSCAYCGARFRVVATHVPDDPHQEEYACPECGKSYATDAASEPEVQLLRPRADGRRNRYEDAMF